MSNKNTDGPSNMAQQTSHTPVTELRELLHGCSDDKTNEPVSEPSSYIDNEHIESKATQIRPGQPLW